MASVRTRLDRLEQQIRTGIDFGAYSLPEKKAMALDYAERTMERSLSDAELNWFAELVRTMPVDEITTADLRSADAE